MIPDLLSIVIVTYNSSAHIGTCLNSLGPKLQKLTIVIDNSSSDGTPDLVEAEFPHVTLVRNPENLGFGRGCNIGFAQTQARYVLVLNPDVVTSPQAIDALVVFAECIPSLGILAPLLVNTDGSRQFSCRTVQTGLTVLFRRTPLGKMPLATSFLRRHLMENIPLDRPSEVDWVLGAYMLVRREALQSVGGFDERFFLYCEDVDWCLRMWKHNWKVIFNPLVASFHQHQQASRGLNLAKRTTLLHLHSFVRFFAKYPSLLWHWHPRFLPSRSSTLHRD